MATITIKVKRVEKYGLMEIFPNQQLLIKFIHCRITPGDSDRSNVECLQMFLRKNTDIKIFMCMLGPWVSLLIH